MLRLTRSGRIFLCVIVVMQLASITSQSGLLIWLVGLIAGCFLVNVMGAIRSVGKVSLRVSNRVLLEVGSAPREPWQLVNSSKRRAKLVTLEHNGKTILRAAEVPPGASVAVAPRDVSKTRGVYPLADASLISCYPFGLVHAVRPTNSEAEVLVFPKLYEAPIPEVRGLEPMLGGRHTGPGRSASGEKFAGVRPMQPGDSYKQIHWKSSAKGTGFMVKAFEQELAGRASLLVHCDPSSTHAEACIRAAGSTAYAGVDAGHQVDFVNLNNSRRVRIQPFGDATRLLEELARYDAATGQLTAKTLSDTLAELPKRTAIHFITTGLTPLLQSKITDLIQGGKLVVVHVPAGATPALDCIVREYPVS